MEISERKINFLRKKIIGWGKNNYEYFPWRNTDNHWHALAAEIMLQRTKADQVVPVFLDFSEKYKTPSEFLNDKSKNIFENLGLHWREDKLTDLAKALEGKPIPSEKKELIALPAIGEYISAAYRSFHLNLFDVIIDSNIVRVYGRFFGFETNNESRRKKEFKFLAVKCTPLRNQRSYNYGILDFSRKICKSDPNCVKCPIAKKCTLFSNP